MRLLVPAPFEEAVESLRSREIMPTPMSSEEIRGLAADVRAGGFFSARTTHARYLQDIRDVVDRILSGELSKAEGKEILQIRLLEYGYDPTRGFEGDAALGIPPARLNSMRDLGSSQRLDLILNTQLTLHRSIGQKIQGSRPAALYAAPCWELVRLGARKIPRGSDRSQSPGWPHRWQLSGGQFYGRGRMIEPKGSGLWERLGSSALFADALDVDVPPFAFNSGLGWIPVAREECVALGVIGSAESPEPPPPPELRAAIKASVKGIDPALIRAALGEMRVQLAEDVARLEASRR